MLSVIIPTFNRQESTSKSIESVLSQGVADEIIVVDDGSSNPFVLEQKSTNISLIRKDKNKGPAAARNTGIAASTQPLISFLDSDDILLKNTLSQRLKYAIEQGILEKKGEHKIIGCSWQETTYTGTVTKVRHPKSGLSSADLFSGCWFCPGSAIIVNRDLFDDSNTKFDERLKRLEDLDLFMRLGQAGATYEAHHIVGVSIQTSDSRYPDVVIAACEAISEKYLGKSSSLEANLQSRLKAYLFYELSRAHISKNEYHRALDFLVKSFIQRPRLKLYPGPGWMPSTS